MEFVISNFKGQVNSLNFVLVTGILSFAFYKLGRRNAGRIFAVVTLFFFILFSTRFLPGYLVKEMESKYTPFQVGEYPFNNGKIYIHVLGGGYTLDKRLPAQGQLSQVGVGRLAEGIRIFHLYDSSILVVSGNIASGDQSVASVTRKAAVSLGIEAGRIEMLEEPATTLEEAKAFSRRYGTRVHVIVVTDAVHMPRAMQFFEDQGIQAHAAPTNYLIKEDNNSFALRWLPAAENFLLMDRVFREFLGTLKGRLKSE